MTGFILFQKDQQASPSLGKLESREENIISSVPGAQERAPIEMGALAPFGRSFPGVCSSIQDRAAN